MAGPDLLRRGWLLILVAMVLALQPRPAGADCNSSNCGSVFDPCHTYACVGDTCVVTPVDCDDGDACTIDGCNPLGAGCTHAPLCPDDGVTCNGAPHCQRLPFTGAICLPAIPLGCDDGNKCTSDSCAEPDGCQHAPVDCNDGNPCTNDGCDAGAGCLHTPILGCCASGADCKIDACSTRLCKSLVCSGDPIPIPCDDDDPATVDVCTPATGCTHTLPTPTTTTTLPSGAGKCGVDTDCTPPTDPCLLAACRSGACVPVPVPGFPSLSCICRRTDPPSCAGQPVPHAIGKRRARACTLIERAAGGGKKAHKLVGQAGHLLAQALRGLSHAKRVSPACIGDGSALLMDGETRAATLRSQL